ncbi:MAG: presqualene diphosphate synthase HpnD [Alphaproteobacteria bacterium]|nr:presqualene diphosphate synthase HpnD [Alphaproteobacteria bacterium]
MTDSALSYTDALRYVTKTVAASGTSFSAGMAVLPKNRREAIYALYAFCRVVDDIADDSPSPEIAAQGLQTWRERLTDLFKGKPTDPITTALLPALSRYNLCEDDFGAIIDGMTMDSTAIVAPSLETLDLYCDRVASAVGRISVRIFGDAHPEAFQTAYHLGRALQLTNILRDLHEDVQRGRLYLPKEFLDAEGLKDCSPKEVLTSPKLPAVCRRLAAIAHDHYKAAGLAMAQCSSSAMRPARIMHAYYGAILEKLERAGWKDPSKRISLSSGKKLYLIFKGFFL